MNDIIAWNKLEELKPLLADSGRRMSDLIKEAVHCITRAKKEHDRLESYYIPNMDFKKIDAIRDEIIGKIEANVL